MLEWWRWEEGRREGRCAYDGKEEKKGNKANEDDTFDRKKGGSM